MFWTEDEFGYLAVHCADFRQHLPPEPGWCLVNSMVDVEADAEVFYYRRVSSFHSEDDSARVSIDEDA